MVASVNIQFHQQRFYGSVFLPAFGIVRCIAFKFRRRIFLKTSKNENKMALPSALFPNSGKDLGAREVVQKTIPPPTAFQNLLVLETFSYHEVETGLGCEKVGEMLNFVSWGLFPADGEIKLQL